MVLTFILIGFVVLTSMLTWGIVKGSVPIKWICAILLLGVFILFVNLLVSSPQESPPKVKRALCMIYLKEIGHAIEMYRSEHDGKNPASLQLLTNYIPDRTMFVCPGRRSLIEDASIKDNFSSYIYRPDAGTNEVLLYCPPKNHKNEGGNILFGDYSGSWFDGDNFEKVLKVGKTGAHTMPRTVL